MIACAGMLTFGVGSKFAKLGQGVLSKFFKTDEAIETLRTGEKLYEIRKPNLNGEPPELGGFPEGISYDKYLKRHMKNKQEFVRKSNKGVVGGHNKKEFLKVAGELDLKIVSITDKGHGIEKVKYQMTALDKSGNVIGYRKELTKTVYNPDIISDAKILEYGQKAASLKFTEKINEGKRIYDSRYMGIDFRVYLNLEEKYITNIHPN